MKTFEIYADNLSNHIAVIDEYEINKHFGLNIRLLFYNSINVFITIDESLSKVLISKLNEYKEESELEKAIRKANINITVE